MTQSKYLLFFLSLLLTACGLSVKTTVTKTLPPLDYMQEVKVMSIAQQAPANAVLVGTVKIGDGGAMKCSYDVVIEKAKMEARRLGGNVLKLTEHQTPDMMSSCHRIRANILKVDSTDLAAAFTEPIDSTLLNANYALVHMYRFGGAGALIGYDIHLGDSVIWRAKNNSKQTVKIYKDGPNSIWARTESKSEVPVDIKFGKEYYIRCGIGMGAFVGRPVLEMVDRATGKAEYEAIK